MPINRNQFIKSLGLGAAIHLLESKVQYESTTKRQGRYGLTNGQINKNDLALKPKALQPGGDPWIGFSCKPCLQC